jgi:hypothetical protein
VGVYFDGFFFAMGHLVGLFSKNNEISPPQVEITFFTLLYIYIVLHSHVQSYEYIYFYIYIVLSDYVNLHKYIYFYTYKKKERENLLDVKLAQTHSM